MFSQEIVFSATAHWGALSMLCDLRTTTVGNKKARIHKLKKSSKSGVGLKRTNILTPPDIQQANSQHDTEQSLL